MGNDRQMSAKNKKPKNLIRSQIWDGFDNFLGKNQDVQLMSFVPLCYGYKKALTGIQLRTYIQEIQEKVKSNSSHFSQTKLIILLYKNTDPEAEESVARWKEENAAYLEELEKIAEVWDVEDWRVKFASDLQKVKESYESFLSDIASVTEKEKIENALTEGATTYLKSNCSSIDSVNAKLPVAKETTKEKMIDGLLKCQIARNEGAEAVIFHSAKPSSIMNIIYGIGDKKGQGHLSSIFSQGAARIFYIHTDLDRNWVPTHSPENIQAKPMPTKPNTNGKPINIKPATTSNSNLKSKPDDLDDDGSHETRLVVQAAVTAALKKTRKMGIPSNEVIGALGNVLAEALAQEMVVKYGSRLSSPEESQASSRDVSPNKPSDSNPQGQIVMPDEKKLSSIPVVKKCKKESTFFKKESTSLPGSPPDKELDVGVNVNSDTQKSRTNSVSGNPSIGGLFSPKKDEDTVRSMFGSNKKEKGHKRSHSWPPQLGG